MSAFNNRHHKVQPMHKILQEEIYARRRLAGDDASSSSMKLYPSSLMYMHRKMSAQPTWVDPSSSSKNTQGQRLEGSSMDRSFNHQMNGTTENTNPPFSVLPKILSSSLWVRLVEWSSIYTEGNGMNSNDGYIYVGEGGGIIPETRRSHSATVYKMPLHADEESTGDADDAMMAENSVQDTMAKQESPMVAQSSSEADANDSIISATATPPTTLQNNNIGTDNSSSTNEDDINTTNNMNSSNTITHLVNENPPNMQSINTTLDVHELIQPGNINGSDIPINSTSNNEEINSTDSSTPPNLRKMQRIENPHSYQEYMIMSGGFSDTDWTNFPIWAFDMTSSILEGKGQWINLTPDTLSEASLHQNGCSQQDQDYVTIEEKKDDLWKNAKSCPPEARVGHMSWMYNGYLYIFGGLLYDDSTGLFNSEKLPYVYRIKLEGKLPPVSFRNESKEIEGWQRIVPKINGGHNNNPNIDELPYNSNDEAPQLYSPPYELLLRGEIQGGLWKNKNKIIMHGGLSVRNIESSSPSSSSSSSTFGGVGSVRSSAGHNRYSYQQIDTPLGDVWSYDLKTDTWEQIASSFPSEQEEMEHLLDDKLQFSYTPTTAEKSNEYPRARTAHAATVVNNELIIYGGMAKAGIDSWVGRTKWEELSDVWVFDLAKREWKKREMTPALERSYHSLVGWESLEKEEEQAGSDGGRSIVASFGGYALVDQPVGVEEVAFVFDDTLISYPPSSNLTSNDCDAKNCDMTIPWMKATWPIDATEGASHRLQHTAVLSDVWGTMYVWGGRFQDTQQVDGMWMLNVAGKKSEVSYHIAEADGLEAYEQTIAFVHVFYAMLIFLSMLLMVMCGLVHRQDEGIDDDDDDSDEGGAARNGQDHVVLPSRGRRRRSGLRQDIIDSLPVKTYRGVLTQNDVAKNVSEEKENKSQPEIYCQEAKECRTCIEVESVSVDDGGDVQSVVPASDGSGSSPESEEDDCCPICLVEYEEGDKIRSLPCRHEFHKECVDPWLGHNASCPACRHSLRELSSDSSPSHAFVRTSLSGRISLSYLMNQLGSWLSQSGNEDVGDSNADDTNTDGDNNGIVETDELDLSYISSLELMEEVAETESSGENANTDSSGDIQSVNTDQPQIAGRTRTRMMALRNGITSRHSSQRTGRRRGIRRGSRMIPLNDPLDPSGETRGGETVLV